MRAYVLISFAFSLAASQPITVTVNSTALGVTETRFLSWNIDPSCNRGFHWINFSNPNLIAAAASLSPSRLRFGGSGADDLVYSFGNDGACASVPPPSPANCQYVTAGCLNATHFSSLLGLLASNDPGAQFSNQFIFGLSFNISQAQRGHPWDPANAQRLLAFLRWPSETVWGFELGNEINNPGGVKPRQQADAITALSHLLGPSGRIIGPDSGGANPEAWDAALLPLVAGALHAVTHHVYLSLTPKTFASTDTLADKLDSPLPEIAWYTALVRQSSSQNIRPSRTNTALTPHTPYTLTNRCAVKHPAPRFGRARTAPLGAATMAPAGRPPYAESGAPRCGTRTTRGCAQSTALCSTTGRTFLAARALSLLLDRCSVPPSPPNIHTRHPHYHRYGLVNSETMAMSLGAEDPVVIKPDFWVSFLWKRLLGTSVLNASTSSRDVRAYAYSDAPPSVFAEPACASAPLQLLLLNLRNASADVALPPGSSTYSLWALAPVDGTALSTAATLNGAALPGRLDVREGDPAFLRRISTPPAVGSVGTPLTLAPLAVAFLCYHT